MNNENNKNLSIEIDSYDSRYPAAYYSIGTPYSFYVSNTNHVYEAKADEKYVKQYSNILKNATQTRNENSDFLAFTRVIGVVVEIEDKEEYKTISALFLRDEGNYVIRKYAVSTYDVFFNGKEYVVPGTKIKTNQIKTIIQPNKGKTGVTATDATGVMVTESTGVTVAGKTGITMTDTTGVTTTESTGVTTTDKTGITVTETTGVTEDEKQARF